MRPEASNSTTSGRVFVEKQCGNVQALRLIFLSLAKYSGLGSTRRPVHWKQKNSMHDNVGTYSVSYLSQYFEVKGIRKAFPISSPCFDEKSVCFLVQQFIDCSWLIMLAPETL